MQRKIRISGVVSNISKYYVHGYPEEMVRIDIYERVDVPNMIVASPQTNNPKVKEMQEFVVGVLQSIQLPLMNQKTYIPRVSIFLTSDEWDKIYSKPTVGDNIIVEIEENKIVIIQQGK